MKARLFFTTPSKIEKSVIPKSFCLSPFRQWFIVINPQLINQQIWIHPSFQVVDLTCLTCLVAGLLLFYNAKRLSKSAVLFYTSGTCIGVLASVLIIVFVLSRQLPLKKSIVMMTIVGGGSFFTFLFYRLKEGAWILLCDHYYIAAGYVLVAGFCGFVVTHKYGRTISSPRTNDVIQWAMQIIALLLMYNGTQLPQASLTIISVVIIHTVLRKLQNDAAYSLSKLSLSNSSVGIVKSTSRQFIKLVRTCSSLFTSNKDQIDFITEEEYKAQAELATKKALEELRGYCSSPECSPWKTVAVLQAPKRFSSFIQGENHVNEAERTLYEIDDEFLDSSDEGSCERKEVDSGDGKHQEQLDYSNFALPLSTKPQQHKIGYLQKREQHCDYQHRTSHKHAQVTDDRLFTDDEQYVTDDEEL